MKRIGRSTFILCYVGPPGMCTNIDLELYSCPSVLDPHEDCSGHSGVWSQSCPLPGRGLWGYLPSPGSQVADFPTFPVDRWVMCQGQEAGGQVAREVITGNLEGWENTESKVIGQSHSASLCCCCHWSAAMAAVGKVIDPPTLSQPSSGQGEEPSPGSRDTQHPSVTLLSPSHRLFVSCLPVHLPGSLSLWQPAFDVIFTGPCTKVGGPDKPLCPQE